MGQDSGVAWCSLKMPGGLTQQKGSCSHGNKSTGALGRHSNMVKGGKVHGYGDFSAGELAAELFDKLPLRVQAWFRPLVRFAKSLVFAFTEVKLEVVQQRCIERFGNSEFDAIYIGRASAARDIEKLFRYKVVSERVINKIFFWQIKTYVGRGALGDALTILHLGGFLAQQYKPDDFLNLPSALKAITEDISMRDVAERSFSKSAKRKMEELEKTQLSWKVCEDVESLGIFYNELYEPHARHRFGDHAIVFDFQKLRRLQRTGYLVLIFVDGRLISGCICRAIGRDLVFELAGIAWADQAPVSRMAGDMIYYVLLKIARQLGCVRVNYRDCRPFMNDGILRYKQRWGGVLWSEKTARRSIAINTPLQSASGRRFFVENYPIFEDGTGLSGLVVLDSERAVGVRDLKRMKKAYLKPGLKRLDVFCAAGFDEEAQRYLRKPDCGLTKFDMMRVKQ